MANCSYGAAADFGCRSCGRYKGCGERSRECTQQRPHGKLNGDEHSGKDRDTECSRSRAEKIVAKPTNRVMVAYSVGERGKTRQHVKYSCTGPRCGGTDRSDLP